MLGHTFTATFAGLQPIQVEVEVDGNRGVPSLVLVGLPSKSTDEARERITAALQNSGFSIQSKRTIVNLAPADIPKHGAGFDVAIALGILKMYGEIKESTEDCLFLGELSLEGRIKQVKGCLPLVSAAKAWGFKKVFIPQENAAEVAILDDIKIYVVPTLRALVDHFMMGVPLTLLKSQSYQELLPTTLAASLDFDDVLGQDDLKRALVVAAAGGHNILLSGSPGMGKSMLAQSLIPILPPLNKQEAIDVTNIYSIAGLNAGKLMTQRPFRNPHHTISYAGLIGGGHPLKPGEISLAHHGILFLDEFLEFPTHLLETLRQPLEAKKITITRAFGSVEYPANFTLVAATNPCPCGYLHSTVKACSCSESTIQRYTHRLSGPLLDRFDLRIHVPELEKKDFSEGQPKVTTHTYRALVQHARERQQQRLLNYGLQTNGEMNSKQVRAVCHVSLPARALLDGALDRLHLSMRSYFKLIKVAQTIADLEGVPEVGKKQMAEALQYR